MKRKPSPKPEPAVIDSEILAQAKRALQEDATKRAVKCEVCGDPCAPNSAEPLCWVCRRLKISAWRDSDPQMTAQE